MAHYLDNPKVGDKVGIYRYYNFGPNSITDDSKFDTVTRITKTQVTMESGRKFSRTSYCELNSKASPYAAESRGRFSVCDTEFFEQLLKKKDKQRERTRLWSNLQHASNRKSLEECKKLIAELEELEND